jgi:hypothetical protein
VNAELLSLMGYDALFLVRDSDIDKKQRKHNGEMEFLWKPKFADEEHMNP